MHGMIIHTFVLHDQTVSLSGLQNGGVGRCGVLRIAQTVDLPEFFVTVPLELGVKNQLDRFCVLPLCGIACPGELAIVPCRFVRLRSYRLAGRVGVFDDNAHSAGLNMLADFTQDPYAGVVHLDDGRDALRGREPKHGNCLSLGYRISI
jgi:hypothetical protein